ncbi:MAG: hypothetical protein ACREL7_09495 [Longimicrobiales bacterium]
MMRCRTGSALLGLLAGLVASPVLAQEPGPTRLRVFLDCNACERDFVRTEINWVDFMLDRADADVHVLVTVQITSTGGRDFSLFFIGGQSYAGITDTLRYVASPDATPVIRQAGLVRKVKIGLMPFIANLPLADRVQISIVEPEGPQAQLRTATTQDPWNYWVFRINGNGFLNGESRQKFSNFSVSLEANRITEAWKVQSSARGSYSENTFEVDSVTTIKSITRSYTGRILLVRSIGGHTSLGAQGVVESSTFGNTEIAWRLAPAIEYNFFPYSESTRRAFTIVYSAGINSFDYRETTIFDRLKETRPAHTLTVGYTTRQTWGATALSVDFSQFLDDTQKYRASFQAGMELRLFRGLSLNLDGVYRVVRDQLSIAKEGATRDEILLRLHELRTDYSYFMFFGLSYRFGSSFDNIVNPRFSNGIGGN